MANLFHGFLAGVLVGGVSASGLIGLVYLYVKSKGGASAAVATVVSTVEKKLP